jgi:hypothetical protein
MVRARSKDNLLWHHHHYREGDLCHRATALPDPLLAGRCTIKTCIPLIFRVGIARVACRLGSHHFRYNRNRPLRATVILITCRPTGGNIHRTRRYTRLISSREDLPQYYRIPRSRIRRSSFIETTL